jgi:hypothetical protein
MNPRVITTWKPAPPRVDPLYYIVGLRHFTQTPDYPAELLEPTRAAFVRLMREMNDLADAAERVGVPFVIADGDELCSDMETEPVSEWQDQRNSRPFPY